MKLVSLQTSPYLQHLIPSKVCFSQSAGFSPQTCLGPVAQFPYLHFMRYLMTWVDVLHLFNGLGFSRISVKFHSLHYVCPNIGWKRNTANVNVFIISAEFLYVKQFNDSREKTQMIHFAHTNVISINYNSVLELVFETDVWGDSSSKTARLIIRVGWWDDKKRWLDVAITNANIALLILFR